MENMIPLSRVEAILMGEPVSIPQSRVEYLLQELVDKMNELANTEIYKAKGSILFADLPTPAASNDGWVYDVTDDFITDSRFKTGAGQAYPGGTNVVIINTGTEETPIYKYDVLGGFVNMDLYVQKEAGKGLSTNDYTNADKTKLGGIAEGAEVNVQSDWNESDNSSDAYIQNKPTLGTASALNVAESGNAESNEVVKGNDSRLTDDRNPTPHTHTTSQITDFPSLGTAAGLNVPATGDASSSEVVKGNDSRVVNSPIASTTTGINPSITDSADGLIQDIKVYGRTDTVEGELRGIGEDGKVDVVTCGKNLFSSLLEQGAYYIDGVKFDSDIRVRAASFMRLQQGVYTISAIPQSLFIAVQIWESNTFGGNTRIFDSGWVSAAEYTFTMPENGKYMTVGFRTASEGNISPIDISGVQLEFGSTATAYEPYISSSAVVTTGIPLYSVGDVKDEVDMLSGVVHKKCYSVTLTSSSSITLTTAPADSSGGNRFLFDLTKNAKMVPTSGVANAICNNLTVRSQNYLYSGTYTDSYSVSGDALYFRVTGIATVEAMQTYLAAHPVTVVYELADPYEIPLTAAELSALRNLRTYASTTNVTVTDAPTSTVDYLLNTGNGQAVADVQNELQGQINDVETDLESGLALKVDKVEGKGLSTNDYTNADKSTVGNSPIANSTTGTSFALSDAANALLAGLTVEGETTLSGGVVTNVGDGGTITITSTNGTATKTATLTTGLPLCSLTGIKDVADFTAGVVHKKCIGVTLDGSDDENYDLKTESGGTTSKRIDFSLIYAAKAPATINDYPPNAISNVNFATENGLWNGWDFGIGIPTNGPILMLRFENIATVADLRTYLAANPVTIVYEVAEFYDDPMTASEVAAYHKLCTFSGTTNITCTDNPTIDIGYLLNTDNGQAVSAVQQGLQAQIIAIPAFIAAIPEMHRNIFRGKNLGTAVTAAQLAAIRNGSFDDLYVGDYWVINGTIWRIADINYFLNCGDTVFTSPHLNITSDAALYFAKMNDTDTTAGGYAGSKMRTENLEQAKTVINNAFPGLVLTHREQLTNAVTNGKPSGTAWYDSTVDLMSEVMIYGHREFSAMNDGVTMPENYSVAKTQFALFLMAPSYIMANTSIYLRDVVSDTKFADVYEKGYSNAVSASVVRGVRPEFCIG